MAELIRAIVLAARPEDKSHLVNEIRKAHVVAIVCASPSERREAHHPPTHRQTC